MELTYVFDYRLARTPDGAVWTDTAYERAFWDRYLSVFDRVFVTARVRSVAAPEPSWRRVDGGRVHVAAVPFYLGPLAYMAKARAIRRAVGQALDPDRAAILRVPSQLASCAASILRSRGQAYAVEVVGDPWESLAPGALRHPLRPLFRRLYPRNQSIQCQESRAACYVSGRLAERYPPGAGRPSWICSDVDLDRDAYVPAPRVFAGEAPVRLIAIASLTTLYKGIDVLIDAMAECVASGLDLSLTIVGDGKHRVELEARSRSLNLEARVRFLGQLPAGQPVREQLDRAALFVLPSRTEGMPRALLEAMARGLPAIGSDVGGVPELLGPGEIVAPGSASLLAAKIREIVTDPARMQALSARNLNKAREYRNALLEPRRQSFQRASLGAQQSGWMDLPDATPYASSSPR